MDTRKHIYLVRHGESETNITHVLGGKEVPLTETGRQQARLVATRFTALPIDIVLSSDYVRAQETARAITEEINVPFETVTMAGEREVPDVLKGLSMQDAHAQNVMKEFYYEWMHQSEVNSGEHFDAVRRRVYELTTLLENRPEQNIVLVSHGFFLKFFVAHHILGPHLTPEIFIDYVADRMRMSNTGISYFTIDEAHTWQIYSWSDFAHLSAPSSSFE